MIPYQNSARRRENETDQIDLCIAFEEDFARFTGDNTVVGIHSRRRTDLTYTLAMLSCWVRNRHRWAVLSPSDDADKWTRLPKLVFCVRAENRERLTVVLVWSSSSSCCHGWKAGVWHILDWATFMTLGTTRLTARQWIFFPQTIDHRERVYADNGQGLSNERSLARAG